MRKLTVNLLVWSATTIAVGDELNFAITGEVLQKGSAKFVGLRKIQDDSFLPDDLRRQALPTSHCTDSGVLSIDG
jgi:hypothetical protein